MNCFFAILLPLLLCYILIFFAPPVQIGEFDHFWFVLTWPPSLCEVKDCNRTATPNFTIHGLWPTDKDGQTLRDILQPNASLSFLEDDASYLVKNLNEYWPSFPINTTNKCFWKHEWDKHGRMQAQVEPENYFNRTVTLMNQDLSRNILSALNERGVVPNNSSYPVSNFISAITNITGKAVMLNCTGGTDNKVLGEVRVCVNHDATEFTECSGKKEKDKTKHSCGDLETSIRFPGPGL